MLARRKRLSARAAWFGGLAALLRSEAALLLCVALLPAAAHAAPEQAARVALVIGNAAYRGTDRLMSPTSDAELLAQSLRAIGFTVDLEENRSRANMLDDLDRFSRSASHASIAFVYYAGHGFESGGENYLIPVDMPIALAEVSQGDLARYAVPMRYVQSSASRGEPRSLLLMLDACRNSTLRGGGGATMAPVQAAHGTLIAFATQPGGSAVDSFSLGSIRHQHSPFAYYLSQQIASAGDIVSALRNTQVAVSVATGDTQRPWFDNGLVGELRLSDSTAPTPDANVRQPSVARKGGRGVASSTTDASPPDDGADAQDERALASAWRAQTLRMRALLLQMVVNPQITQQVRDNARRGDLFSMTTLALSLFVAPDDMPAAEAQARVAEGTLYLNAASDRHYPMADAARAGWLFAHATLPSDNAAVIHYFREAVDHGYAESLPRLIQLLTVTGDGNLDMYLVKYHRIYGRDYDYPTMSNR